MTKTLGSTWQDKNDAELVVSRSEKNTQLNIILDSFDKGFNSPLRMRAGFPSDSKVYFEPSITNDVDASKKSLPAIKGNVPSVVLSSIDFQTGITSGTTFVGTWPSDSTVGKFRRVAFCYDPYQAKMNFAFSAEFATVGELPNVGGLLNKKFIPCGWIDIVCTSANWFKSANATTDIIEASDIVRFGASGSSGSGGIDSYSTIALASAEPSGAVDDICFVVETQTFYRYQLSSVDADSKYFLSITNDANSRWVGISGKYNISNKIQSFATIADAELVNINTDIKLFYVIETKTFYELQTSNFVIDNLFVLTVEADNNLRLIGVSGQYDIFNQFCRFLTISNASLVNTNTQINTCYVIETGKFYSLETSSEVVDGDSVLSVTNDETKRWLSISTGGGSSASVLQEVFTISAPQTTFTLTSFTPDANMLKCYHVQTGQVYVVGTDALTLSGNDVVFPDNSFSHISVSETATLIFEQPVGITYRRVTH